MPMGENLSSTAREKRRARAWCATRLEFYRLGCTHMRFGLPSHGCPILVSCGIANGNGKARVPRDKSTKGGGTAPREQASSRHPAYTIRKFSLVARTAGATAATDALNGK